MKKVLENIRAKRPLVHCITNFVTVNDCANIILAVGGTPTMTHDIREVEEIISAASALVLNIGTVGNIDAMILAAKRANALGRPVVLDPVAAGASKLRYDSCTEILKQVRLSVIKGNISEIKALATGHCDARGVDAGEKDAVTNENFNDVCQMAQQFSKKTGAVIVISGRLDIVADAERVAVVANGCCEMARITGSGCMLASLIGVFVGAQPENIFDAAFKAVAAMGLCGEIARDKIHENREGTGSFRTYLIDAASLLDDECLERGQRVEDR